MTERTTTAMLDNAMEYLAELMGVAFVPPGRDCAEEGDITYYNNKTNEDGRFYRFGIYRWYTETPGVRKLATHDPEGYKSYTKRDLHTAIRFMCAALYASRGIKAKGE